ncbi:MAG: chromosomal replication initiator DnaA [Acidithiobacillus sp.]|nr:chromosomal replication initiator DnaA [Acidithiobacillus sp.]
MAFLSSKSGTQPPVQELLPLERLPLPVTNLPGLNEAAIDALGRLRVSPDFLALHGERGSGKTHLLLWAAFANGGWAPYFDCAEDPKSWQGLASLADASVLFLDNVDAWAGQPRAEEQLFILYNYRKNNKLAWVVSSRTTPGQCPWTLPDWASRVAGATHYGLVRPGEEELTAILRQQAKNRGRCLPDTLLHHLLRQEERNLAKLVPLLDDFYDWLSRWHGSPSVRQWRRYCKERNGG